VSELRPWDDGESILALIRTWPADVDAPELPDEPPFDATELRWAAGAVEGVASRHGLERDGESRDGDHLATEIAGRLRRLAQRGGARERLAVYRIAQAEDVLPHVDVVLERLGTDVRARTALLPHARWLVTEARHRGPLKLGIALLGVCGDETDVATLTIVARHDEFTVYCCVALMNLLGDPSDALWEIARTASGWGKIEAVERLARFVADRPDIRRWLITDGCPNAVMDEYLGYVCATAGELATALAHDVDDPILDGACTTVSALCEGGPAEDLDDYTDGPFVVTRLVGLLEDRCTTLPRLNTVLDLHGWLETDGDAERSERLAGHGWTDALRESLRARCQEMLARPQWPERVRSALARGEPPDDWMASRVGRHLGLDLWDVAFERLLRDPLDLGLVVEVLQTGDIERLRRVLAWAEENLGPDPVDTAPAHRLIGGTADVALEAVLGRMRGGLYSERLAAAALRSPVFRVRHAGLDAVRGRPQHAWGQTVRDAVRALAGGDADNGLRAQARALLASAGPVPRELPPGADDQRTESAVSPHHQRNEQPGE
jgi:hypothetical protein